VRDVRNDLDVSGRNLKLTAAVIADQSAALNRYLQDWPEWLREGIIDAAIPMAYGKSTPVVERQIAAAMAIPTERHVYAGIALYNEGAPGRSREDPSRSEARSRWDRALLLRLARGESGLCAATAELGAAPTHAADDDEVARGREEGGREVAFSAMEVPGMATVCGVAWGPIFG
jgi:hypothetical protein